MKNSGGRQNRQVGVDETKLKRILKYAIINSTRTLHQQYLKYSTYVLIVLSITWYKKHAAASCYDVLLLLPVELTLFSTWLTPIVYETKGGLTVSTSVVAFHWVRVTVRVYKFKEYISHVVEKAVRYARCCCVVAFSCLRFRALITFSLTQKYRPRYSSPRVPNPQARRPYPQRAERTPSVAPPPPFPLQKRRLHRAHPCLPQHTPGCAACSTLHLGESPTTTSSCPTQPSSGRLSGCGTAHPSFSPPSSSARSPGPLGRLPGGTR